MHIDHNIIKGMSGNGFCGGFSFECLREEKKVKEEKMNPWEAYEKYSKAPKKSSPNVSS